MVVRFNGGRLDGELAVVNPRHLYGNVILMPLGQDANTMKLVLGRYEFLRFYDEELHGEVAIYNYSGIQDEQEVPCQRA